MSGVTRLNNHLTFFFSSSGAATNLCDQLKCSFIGSEIREVHHAIGIKDTH